MKLTRTPMEDTMRSPLLVTCVLAGAALVGCGGPAPETGGSGTEGGTAPAGSEATTVEESDICAPIEVELVPYDTAGTTFPYTFDVPRGWEVTTVFTDTTASADLTADADGDGGTDFVLRLGGSTKTVGNVDRLVATNHEISRVEEVATVDLAGRTLHVFRSVTGDLVGYTALFPAGEPNTAYTVIGGVTDAPEACMERALEVMQAIMTNLRPNPDIATP